MLSKKSQIRNAIALVAFIAFMGMILACISSESAVEGDSYNNPDRAMTTDSIATETTGDFALYSD